MASGRTASSPATPPGSACGAPPVAAIAAKRTAASGARRDLNIGCLPRSEELLNRRMAVVDDRHRPIGRADERRLDVDAERFVNRRGHVGRRDRPIARITANLVGCPDHLAPLDAAAAHENRPAVRPVIAAAGGIYLRGAPALPHS